MNNRSNQHYSGGNNTIKSSNNGNNVDVKENNHNEEIYSENFQNTGNTLENLQNENDFNESYHQDYQNFNYMNQSFNQNDASPRSNQNTEDSKPKDSEQKLSSNMSIGDKPWNRASRDASIIQKGTELFVGNLSLDTIEQDLYDNFQECGDIIDVIFYLILISLFTRLNF
jgi:RNA recognition motif-containing protein